jgi:CelD/BcsL family acetyltransferase involved in cellulose biosynthesis
VSALPTRIDGAPLRPPVVSDRPLAVELRHDLALPAADAAVLDDLRAARPELAVFVSDAWLSGFFADPDGAETCLALFRDGARLCGFVPLAIRRSRAGAEVSLLGGGAGSDRTDLVAERGREAACADALLEWLSRTFGARWSLTLRDVPAESSLWGAVHRASAERGERLAVEPREVHTLPFLDLTELRGASSAAVHPASLAKHRRWLERRGRLRVERVEEPAEVLHGLDELTAFLHARWEGHAEGSALDDPRRRRFHRHVLPRLAAEGRLRLLHLTVDGRTVAVFHGVGGHGWWGYCLAGFDRNWAGRIRLGHLTLAAAIDLAAQEGAAEFDFLKGAHRTKYLWPVRERATLDAVVHASGWGPQLSRAAWSGRDAAAALARAARSVLNPYRSRGTP